MPQVSGLGRKPGRVAGVELGNQEGGMVACKGQNLAVGADNLGTADIGQVALAAAIVGIGDSTAWLAAMAGTV